MGDAGGKTAVSNYEMNGDSFRNTMHSLNYGSVMEAAARNYMKEVESEQAAAGNMGPVQYDLEDLEDDNNKNSIASRSSFTVAKCGSSSRSPQSDQTTGRCHRHSH